MKDLVNIEELSTQELMELTGQSSGQMEINFPELRVNREGETDTGQALPVGSFFVYYKGDNVYAKTVRFRPFINSYQYRVYDEQNQKYTNRSIIFRSWSDEAVDELGGVKCGKVKRKDLESLTEDQKAVQKKIKCNRLLFGLVTMKGVTADNREIEITDYPVCWRSGGLNWMTVDDALESLTKRKLLMQSYWLNLSLYKEKRGGNSFYLASITVDLDNPDPLEGKVIVETFNQFMDVIKNVNSEIIEKYKTAQKALPQLDDDVGNEFDSAKELDGQFTEVNELNDDISDLGKA